MKLHNLIALLCLSITPLQASLIQEETQDRKSSNCKIVLKEIEDTKKMLGALEKVASDSATKRNYEELLADVLKVYKEASINENLDVEQELRAINMKSFYAENFY